MANLNYSRVTVAGRLTEDPELRQTTSGKVVTTFSVAVNKPGKTKDVASFFKVVAWDSRAEFVTRYFRKGSSIFVEGALNQRTWMDPKGVRRSEVTIVAAHVEFVDSKNEHTGAVPAEDDAPVYVPIDDDDMPF